MALDYITFSEMRLTLRDWTSSDATQSPNINCDRAFRRAAFAILNEVPKLTRASLTKDLTAFIAEVDLTGEARFREENIFAMEITLKDRSTWATSTSYAVRDVVVGDGSPDAYLYKCISAHTSAADKEPPNTTYWQRVYSKFGDKVDGPIDFAHMYRLLTKEGSTGLPTHLAINEHGTGYVYPAPDDTNTYTLKIWYYGGLVTDKSGGAFVVGESTSSLKILIPRQFMDDIMEAAAAVLDAPMPDTLTSNPTWQRYIGITIPAVRSQFGTVKSKTLDYDSYLTV